MTGRAAAALLVAAALSGCAATLPAPAPTMLPPERVAVVPDLPPAPPPPDPIVLRPPAGPPDATPTSDIARYYARVQSDLRGRGLLREERAPADAPWTAQTLARNFAAIALFDEYVVSGGTIRAATTRSTLRRWQSPVRMAPVFGDSVAPDRRASDRALIGGYAARLSAATGLPISLGDEASANFHVLILDEAERRAFGPRLRALVPGISAPSVRAFTDLDRSTLCLVLAFSRGASSVYDRAVALIPAEHPDLMRRSCIHEELAQGLGLANDSPAARPSIFNDDEEFALLTDHDEALLRILYDPRLTPGMTEAQAMPTVLAIAREIAGGGA
ncbi:MAG: DUF2927 domain-containing protein [Paracoccaceae bacterium]